MIISNFEQQIYNCHLKHFRNGQPWKPRKDFTDLSSSDRLYLQKLTQFFGKFSHISPEDFFAAPRNLHPDEPTPPLKFFISRTAIKSYTIYQKQKINQSPDKQIEEIKKGLEFIALFCSERNLSLEQYVLHLDGNGPSWIEHYRTHSINPYCIMELLNFSNLSRETENVVWDSNIVDNFFAFRNRYHQSISAKKLVKEATSKISKFLKSRVELPTISA